MSHWFARIANRVAQESGGYRAFLGALTIVLIWAAAGPLFGFSTTWQLVINTGTTIVTFLMVFLIQNTQHRDALAVHLKLDELIRVIAGADNTMMGAEGDSDEELAALKRYYQNLCDEQVVIKARLERVLRPASGAQIGLPAPVAD